MYFNPNLNYGAVFNAQDLKNEKKEKEKEKAEQGENKGNTPQIEIPKEEPVKASAMEILAKMNQGIIHKLTGRVLGTVGGDIGFGSDYNYLTNVWKRESNSMSADEKISLLQKILAQVGTNKEAECQWGMLLTEVSIEKQQEDYEAFLEKLQSGELKPNEVNFDNPLGLEGDFNFPGVNLTEQMEMYYRDSFASANLGEEVSEWPVEIQKTYYKQIIAECKLYLAQYDIQLSNPNLSRSERDEILQSQRERQTELRNAQAQLRQLG